MTHLIWETDFIRWLAVADIAILLACGLYSNVVLREVMRADPERLLWRHYLAGFGHALVELSVALGAIANVASIYPPTPGIKVIACVATPAAVYVAAVLFWPRRTT